MCTLSAGSNISGTLVDVDRAAILCHKFETLAIFDYAAVSPYLPINVGGISPDRPHHHFEYCIPYSDHGLAYKDAIFFSPHKLIGGP